MKNWYTAQELAELSLPGLPAKSTHITRKLSMGDNKHLRRYRKQVGKGRNPLEFHVSCFPDEARAVLLGGVVAIGEDAVPAKKQPSQKNLGNLAKWQRDKVEAKLAIYGEFKRLSGEGNQKIAVESYTALHNRGLLDASVYSKAKLIGRNGRITSRTVFGIVRDVEKYLAGVAGVDILVPAHGRHVADRAERGWVPFFEQLYNTYDKKSVRYCWAAMKKQVLLAGISYPSYTTVQAWNKNRPRADRERGRRTGAEMLATKGFKRRVAPEWPCDAYQCDGYSFPAYIKHPETGRVVLPEVCIVMDWATRVIVGFSIGLAESSATVGEALIRSFGVSAEKRYGGVPAILYTDGGSGNIGKRITSQLGLLNRAGVGEHKTGRPGNPQGRGLIERHNHVLHSAARHLWTYRPSKGGEVMDRGVARKRYLQIMKNQRDNNRELGLRTCTLEKVPTYVEVIGIIARECFEHNNSPHSGLVKYYCAEHGREEYLTPVQAWDMAVDRGWSIPLVPQAVLELYEYPQYERTCNRCEVRLHNNIYYSPYLDAHHAQRVIVECDVANPQRVKIRNIRGEYICHADHNGNSTLCFAESEIERARRKRTEGIVKRKQEAIDDQNKELELLQQRSRVDRITVSLSDTPKLVQGCDPVPPALPVDTSEPEDVDTVEPDAVPDTPVAMTDDEWHKSLVELVESGEVLAPDDRELLEEYYQSDNGSNYLDFGGRNLLDE